MTWDMVPLGELIESAQPGFASGKNVVDGVIQIRMNNVDTEGRLSFDTTRRVPATQKELDKCALTVGDVLFNNTNSPELVGKCCMFKGHHETVVFSNHFTRLKSQPDKLDPKFLVYFLVAKWQQGLFAHICKRWVNQAAVQKERLFEVKIPLPPLSEQKRIAAILDKADAIRRKRKAALDMADEFLRATFLDMFGDPVTNPKGWDVVDFGDACDVQLGKMLSKKAKQGVNPIPYLNNRVVRWREFKLTELPEMDYSEREMKKFNLVDGDILACEGGEVGRCAIWREQLSPCSYQKALHRIRPHKGKSVPEYIQEYLFWMARRNGLVESTSTATIAHLTAIKLKGLKLPLPPIELQSNFIKVYGRYTKNVQGLNRLIGEANALFASLSQRAFRGEL